MDKHSRLPLRSISDKEKKFNNHVNSLLKAIVILINIQEPNLKKLFFALIHSQAY
jgi:hypothetical protein